MEIHEQGGSLPDLLNGNMEPFDVRVRTVGPRDLFPVQIVQGLKERARDGVGRWVSVPTADPLRRGKPGWVRSKA